MKKPKPKPDIAPRTHSSLGYLGPTVKKPENLPPTPPKATETPIINILPLYAQLREWESLRIYNRFENLQLRFTVGKICRLHREPPRYVEFASPLISLQHAVDAQGMVEARFNEALKLLREGAS